MNDGRFIVRELLRTYLRGMDEYASVLMDVYGLNNYQLQEIYKMAISNKLSQLSKTWKKVVPVAGGGFQSVPDGDYVGDLKEMKVEESKKGRLQVVSTFEIVDGEYIGKTQKRFDGIEEETGMGYFKGMCEIIGMDIPEDLEMLQEAMDDFVANNQELFNIHIKNTEGENGKSYSNLYVNGINEEFSKGDGGEVESEEQVEEEAQEEQVEEEQVEEAQEEAEEVQAPPIKKFQKSTATAAKTVSKPVAKAPVKASVSVKKPVASVPTKKLVRR